MLKNKLVLFVIKRVLICLILLSIIDMLFIKQRWYMLVGLLLGGIFSVLRFGSSALVFKRILTGVPGTTPQNNYTGSSIVVFIINQIILLPLLFVALKFNQWFFTGTVAGILLVPFVMFINSITEVLKITHNNFE